MITFGLFRLDLDERLLWREGQRISLRPKGIAVLAYLAQRPGRLVTKNELLDALWPGVAVGEEVVNQTIREIRRALGDRAANSTFIETVHGAGHRWVAGVIESATAAMPAPPPAPAAASVPTQEPLIGRERELQQLQACWQEALAGARQVVFITGEAGIGKTTVVEKFVNLVAEAGGTAQPWVGYGDCVEQYSTIEAFMPLRDCLARLCGGPHGDEAIELLRRCAPVWLEQLPGVLGSDERQALRQEGGATAPESMLPLLVSAIDALAAVRPLIIVLEDLHWSDLATIDVINRVASKREPAPLLLIATYRPVEASIQELPLATIKQTLLAHRRCVDLPLGYLGKDSLRTFVASRYPGLAASPEVIAGWQRRTAGNPLFVVTLLDDLRAQGILAEEGDGWRLLSSRMPDHVPDSLRGMIDQQIARLSVPQQQVLEAASVIGSEFSATGVGALLELAVEQVEDIATVMARRQQILEAVDAGAGAADTTDSFYRFTHPLYQEVLYARLPPLRRQLWHERYGQMLAKRDSAHPGELAATAAWHFERAANIDAAVQHYDVALAHASEAHAHHRVVQVARSALDLVPRLPAGPVTDAREITLRLSIATSLMAINGYGDPEIELHYRRAYDLGRRGDLTPQSLFPMAGLTVLYAAWGDLPTAESFALELVEGAAQLDLPPMAQSGVHLPLGHVLCFAGKFEAARTHLEEAVRFADVALAMAHAGAGLWVDLKVSAFMHLATVLAGLGFPQQAAEHAKAGLERARSLPQKNSLLLALPLSVLVCRVRSEAANLRAYAEEATQVLEQLPLPIWEAHASALCGVALIENGEPSAGIDKVQHGLLQLSKLRVRTGFSVYAVPLIEALQRTQRPAEALSTLEETLRYVEVSGERLMEAELHRLRGELLLAQDDRVGAEACFWQALEIAARQGSKWCELRATLSLCRLWNDSGRGGEVRPLLQPLYDWFTEGHDLPELQEARALLS